MSFWAGTRFAEEWETFRLVGFELGENGNDSARAFADFDFYKSGFLPCRLECREIAV